MCYNDVCIDKSLIHPAMLQLLLQHLAMQDSKNLHIRARFGSKKTHQERIYWGFIGD